MASGLILGILFMRYQKWYLAAVAARNTVWNCMEFMAQYDP